MNLVGGESLRHITPLKRLRVLDLGYCRALDDAGLQHLAALTQLEELDLPCTSVSDHGLKTLKQMKSLRKLDLSYTQVSKEGIKSLRRALPQCDIDPKWNKD